MALYAHSDILDAALSEIKNNATLLTVCSAAPTTRTEAVTTYALADVSVTSTDFTISDVAGVGRKVTVAEKTSIPIDISGTMTHVAIVDGARLLAVLEVLTSQVLTAGGNTLDLPVFDILIRNPA